MEMRRIQQLPRCRKESHGDYASSELSSDSMLRLGELYLVQVSVARRFSVQKSQALLFTPNDMRILCRGWQEKHGAYERIGSLWLVCFHHSGEPMVRDLVVNHIAGDAVFFGPIRDSSLTHC